jgi:hypothetical protein
VEEDGAAAASSSAAEAAFEVDAEAEGDGSFTRVSPGSVTSLGELEDSEGVGELVMDGTVVLAWLGLELGLALGAGFVVVGAAVVGMGATTGRTWTYLVGLA